MIYITYIKIGKYMIVYEEYQKNRKNPIYNLYNQQNEFISLGQVKWNSKMRQYCFYPIDETVFNNQCLMDLVNFINWLHQIRKEGKKNASTKS